MNIGTNNALGAIHEFWDWWSDELAAMLPKNLRGEPTERDRFDIFLGAEETVIETVQAGSGSKMQEASAIENLPAESWEEIEALSETQKPRLFLASEDILAVPVKMPKTSNARLVQALELQLPGLVPLRPHLLDWNFVETDRSEVGVELALIAAKTSRLDDLENLFAEQGLMPPTFCAAYAGQTVVLRRPLEIKSSAMSDRKVQMAMAAAFMLAMIPILTLGGAKLMTSVELGRIERLESDLSEKLVQDKRILKEEMVRRAAAPLLKMPSASNRLELMARQLPVSDWAVSASQNVDGRFEFVVDMADRSATETALKKAKLFKKLDPVEELPLKDAPLEDQRVRVRYQVGR